MYSSKTTSLGALLRRHEIAKRRCCLVKLGTDTRYSGDRVETHDRITLPFPTRISTDSTLASVDVSDMEVVGVEEGQFYTDVAETAARWRDSGKIVVVSALLSTFMRTPFPTTAALLCVADRITPLLAVCARCGDEAPFTHRTTPAAVDAQAYDECLIGGPESYVALCNGCYLDARPEGGRAGSEELEGVAEK